eukprot:gene6045-2663_t
MGPISQPPPTSHTLSLDGLPPTLTSLRVLFEPLEYDVKYLADLSALQHCTALTALHLDGVGICDSSAWKACASLRHIHISNSPHLNDIGALQHCIALQELTIIDSPVSSFASLAYCTGLQSVVISLAETAPSKTMEQMCVLSPATQLCPSYPCQAARASPASLP